jgi:hypothetical protein
MSLRQILVWLLFAAIVAAGTAWFLKNFERATFKVRSGYSGEALRNPWLAAQRLSQRMGARAVPIVAPPELRGMAPTATLFLPARRQALPWPLREAIVAWVAGGGRLVVEAERPGQPDSLLDAFGVTRDFVRPEGGGTRRGEATLDVRLPGRDHTSRVRLPVNMRLKAGQPAFAFDSGYGIALLMLERGKGRVFVLNSLEFASNDHIGSEEHARFFWDLVSRGPAAGTIYFYSRPGKLSLAEWLRHNAWAPLAGLAALVLLWLWAVAPRFGPVAPDPARGRRRLLDHLRASGRFLWSNGGAQRMLDAARDACLRRIGRAHPDFLAAADAERARLLAELIGWQEDRTRRLLAPAAAGRMVEFMDTIALYQSVHEHFARKARASPRKPR